MRRIAISGTSLSVSRFAFGTGSLHHVGNIKAQADLLQAAADSGFSHFDTAPLYGFGSAECALGKAFGRGSTAELTIATKVGRYAPGSGSQPRMVMLGRKVLGTMLTSLSRAQADWSVARARASLDRSLSRLKRERVDLLLLHEPQMGLLATDEWLRWLESEAGQRIGSFGLAGHPTRLAPFVTAESALTQVLQNQDSLNSKEADLVVEAGRCLQLTYGYISNASSGSDPESTLAGALKRNQTGAVIVSTRKRSRLATFAAITEAED